MQKFLKFISVFSMLSFIPTLVFAQSAGNAKNLSEVLDRVSNLMGSLLPVLVSLGVLYFVWGVVQYVIGDDEEAKSKGKNRIIYGLIGLAVIVSVWGLVNILADTLGTGRGTGAPSDINNLVVQSTAGGGACPLAPKLQGLFTFFTCLIGSYLIPLLFAVAVAMFIWGAIKFFIIETDEEAKRTQGKQFMIWGIIALTVMISVWGLVNILVSTFGIPNVLPTVAPS